MGTPPPGISEADWAATPVGVRAGFLELVQYCQEQQEEIEQLRAQLTALATELASLRERIQGLLEVCPNRPRRAAALTVS
jgi:chromosome segregation ATPase